MRSVNPWVIARNHRVEEALAAASDNGDTRALRAAARRAQAAVRRDAGERTPYAEPAPAAVTACYRTFCGT